MYKIEIGVFEGDRYEYKVDEEGYICVDENDERIIERENKNRPFIPVISASMTDEEAAEKVQVLLKTKFGKWNYDKVLETFEHTLDKPKTLILDWPKNDYAFRLIKVDA